MLRDASIPQADPKGNYLAHKDEIDAAIARVLDSGQYIMGQEVAKFESEFAAYLAVRYSIGIGSGTEALHIALRACEIGPGDAVMTVAHTAVATVAATQLCGATPVLVDIDPVTYTIDPNRIEDAARELCSDRRRAIGGRLKAIIPVHLYGHPADMESIISIAHRYGLLVIEDCAQSHGAVYRGRPTGIWGDMAAFSFYPTKNLGALGDGGMVVTDDPALAERARQLREYGWRDRFISEVPGLNSRLDELQAAVLRVKLQYLDRENETRRVLAAIYDDALKGTRLQLPVCRSDAIHVYHQYVFRCDERDRLQAFLRQRGIRTSIHYPVPIHLQPAYRGRIPSAGTLHHTEAAALQVLSLPMYPELLPAQAHAAAEAILTWDRALLHEH